MFEGFAEQRLPTTRGQLYARTAGNGPPLLLLHGYPETHLMWRDVAPRLTERFTVVAVDLPGYGRSFRPPASADHAAHSKRAMAADVSDAMEHLGFATFHVAGHDRGARVAYRLALDAPGCVQRLAVIDIVPTADMWAKGPVDFALRYWHWGFLAQPAPLPEALITADPETFFAALGLTDRDHPPEVLHEYRKMLRDYDAVHAMCEDFRAGATIDRQIDESDRGTKIAAPTLVLWGARAFIADAYDVLGIWRTWAQDVHGRPLDASHFVPEERPVEVADALAEFFTGT
jgi:haloacetate dehalogenase